MAFGVPHLDGGEFQPSGSGSVSEGPEYAFHSWASCIREFLGWEWLLNEAVPVPASLVALAVTRIQTSPEPLPSPLHVVSSLLS